MFTAAVSTSLKQPNLELRGRDHQEHHAVLLDQAPCNVRVLDIICWRHHDAAAHAQRQPDVHDAAVEDERHGLEEHGSWMKRCCRGAVVVEQVHHTAMAYLYALQHKCNVGYPDH